MFLGTTVPDPTAVDAFALAKKSGADWLSAELRCQCMAGGCAHQKVGNFLRPVLAGQDRQDPRGQALASTVIDAESCHNSDDRWCVTRVPGRSVFLVVEPPGIHSSPTWSFVKASVVPDRGDQILLRLQCSHRLCNRLTPETDLLGAGAKCGHARGVAEAVSIGGIDIDSLPTDSCGKDGTSVWFDPLLESWQHSSRSTYVPQDYTADHVAMSAGLPTGSPEVWPEGLRASRSLWKAIAVGKKTRPWPVGSGALHPEGPPLHCDVTQPPGCGGAWQLQAGSRPLLVFCAEGPVVCDDPLYSCQCGSCTPPRATGEREDIWFMSDKKAFHVLLPILAQTDVLRAKTVCSTFGTVVRTWNELWGTDDIKATLDAKDFLTGHMT